MRHQREKYGIPADVVSWFCKDGEQVQIDCVVHDEESVEEFKGNLIEVGKTNASRTECEQACDAGVLFMNTNTALRKITDGRTEFYEVPYLKERLDRVYTKHEGIYGKMESVHRTAGIKGCCYARQSM